jgi:hypothetical protein
LPRFSEEVAAKCHPIRLLPIGADGIEGVQRLRHEALTGSVEIWSFNEHKR